ncbi:MAG: hypothetical protein HRF49_10545 [bacterium]
MDCREKRGFAFDSAAKRAILLASAALVVLICTEFSASASPQAKKISEIKLLPGLAADFAVSPGGKIYVSNAGSDLVEVYDGQGEVIATIRPPVDAADYFSPGAIAAEGDDLFWVVDSLSGRLFHFFSDGNFVQAISLSADGKKPGEIASLVVLQPSAPHEIETVVSPEGESPEHTVIERDEAAVAGKNGGAIFVQTGGGAIHCFELDGDWNYALAPLDPPAIRTPAGIALSYPLLYALDSESRTLLAFDVSDSKGKVSTVPLSGVLNAVPVVGIAVSSAGNPAIVCGGSAPVWFRANGKWIPAIERAPTGAQPPIARIQSGRIYFLDRDAGVIEVYEFDGGVLPE